MATIAFAGNYAGTIISMPASGLLARSFGWESLFYVFGKYLLNLHLILKWTHIWLTIFSFKGTIGCVWYILWILIVRENPAKDKFISKDELRYIQESIGSPNSTNIKHPWKSIFTSKAVYAISASHFAENWGFYTLLTQLPSFLKGMTAIKEPLSIKIIHILMNKNSIFR